MNHIISVALIFIALLMMEFSIPFDVIDVMVGIEFIFLIVLILVLVTYCKVIPKLVMIFSLFSSALNISLTRVSISSYESGIKVSSLEFISSKLGENYPIVNIIIIATFLVLKFYFILKIKENFIELGSGFLVIKSWQSELDSTEKLKLVNVSEGDVTELKEDVSQREYFYSHGSVIPTFLTCTARANISLSLLNLVSGMIIQITNLGCTIGIALKNSTAMAIGNEVLSAFPVIIVSLVVNVKKNRDIKIIKSKLKKFDELHALIWEWYGEENNN